MIGSITCRRWISDLNVSANPRAYSTAWRERSEKSTGQRMRWIFIVDLDCPRSCQSLCTHGGWVTMESRLISRRSRRSRSAGRKAPLALQPGLADLDRADPRGLHGGGVLLQHDEICILARLEAAGDVVHAALPRGVQRDGLQRRHRADALVGVEDVAARRHEPRHHL